LGWASKIQRDGQGLVIGEGFQGRKDSVWDYKLGLVQEIHPSEFACFQLDRLSYYTASRLCRPRGHKRIELARYCQNPASNHAHGRLFGIEKRCNAR